MAWAFSAANVSGTTDAGATTQASSSTVVPADNVCYVMVINSDGSPAAPTGVVWDSAGVNESLTQIGTTISHGTYARASLWRGIGLTAKTAVFTATWSGNQGERMTSVYLCTGLDNATPNGTVGQNQGTNTTPTTGAITTTVGQRLLAMGSHLNTGNSTRAYNSPTGTERAEALTAPDLYDGGASQDFEATSTSTTLQWTLSDFVDSWAMFAVPLNDAAAAGSILPRKPLIISTAVHQSHNW
jgi:hypothetical protein